MNTRLKALAVTLLFGTMMNAATVATVNGTAISEKEVNRVLMEGTQGRFNQLPAEKQNELRTRIVDGMITQELVYADAKKSGVLNSEEYKKELTAVMDRIERQLAAKVWEKQQFDKIQVDEKAVKAYYEANPQEFIEKEKVHARHILVKEEAKANALIGELNGLSGDALKNKFVELAKKESTGPSGPKGGDLGLFPQGQMVPAFNDAVFSMKVGTITATPVKTQFGYHIIYLEEKKVGKTLSFDEVKGFVEQRLKIEEFKKVMEAKMKSLKDSAKITYAK
ncbi:MAG: peptidyl-prolyl cis-trans isomerase [Campylobacterota bacterium]|nr:peptidyl-prolyl cis-trans isomerase [Campylobacterota bacterium]